MSLERFTGILTKIMKAKRSNKELEVFVLISDEAEETETKGSGVLVPVRGMSTVNETDGKEFFVIMVPDILEVKKAIDTYLQLKGLKKHGTTKPN